MESGDQITNDTSSRSRPIVRSTALVMDAIRIPPGSWSEMYASHLPSGDGRPPTAARFSSRGSPPSVGMEYTLDPVVSLAVKTTPASPAHHPPPDPPPPPPP